MPITFRCECGKKLQVKDEFAGKKCACPQCGAKSVVPTQSSEAVATEAPPPALEATRPYLPETQTQSEPPPAPRSRTMTDEPPSRRSQPRPRSNVGLFVALALVLLLGAGGGFATWWYAFRSPSQTPTPTPSPKPAEIADDLALIPDDALGFVAIQLGEWWKTEHAQKLLQQLAPLAPLELVENAIGVAPDQIQRVLFIVPEPKSFCVIITTKEPVKPEAVQKILAPNAVSSQHEGKNFLVDARTTLHFAEGNRRFFFGSQESVQDLATRSPESKGGSLDTARKLTEKHLIVVGFNPDTKDIRDAAREIPEDVRKDYPALLKAKTLAITFDITDELHLKLDMTMADESAAKQAHMEIKQLIELGREQLAELKKGIQADLRPVAEPAYVLVESMLRTVQIQQVQAKLDVDLRTEKGVLTDQMVLLVPAIQKVREAAAKANDGNNLKQLAIALHNYQQVYGAFPAAAICDPQGRPLLSWRVAILPFMEQGGALYKQFHLNEPWDSPHNKKLLDSMPPQFRSPSAPDPAYTTRYRVFSGPHALFPERPRPGGPNLGPRITDISDGSSNTLLIVEAGEGVPWTKPDELPYDPQKPLPKLGSRPEGFNGAFADGSVRFFKMLDEKTLRALITPRGAEVIQLPD